MRARQLTSIVQQPEPGRYPVLAEGLELLAENVATLQADASYLSATRRDRSAAVLRGLAEEEAAKVLVIMDIARSGWKNHSHVKASLKAFYSHLSRGLYVRAYGGSPASLGEVRGYVDHYRQRYYLDGPNGADWIYPNDVMSEREERLYVDYVAEEDGASRWVGPAERSAWQDAPFAFPALASTIVTLVSNMSAVGLLTADGLQATRSAWDGVPVSDAMHFQSLLDVTKQVLINLANSGIDEAGATSERLNFIANHWIFPMYTLDLQEAAVDLEDLRQRREKLLDQQFGDY